jgi:hypothetical protein
MDCIALASFTHTDQYQAQGRDHMKKVPRISLMSSGKAAEARSGYNNPIKMDLLGEDFMSRITAVRGKRTGTCLPAAEARLLTQINHGFTNAWWDSYRDLVSKRQEFRLNAAEHQQLIRLTDELEQREAKRLQALVKLAKLRKQSLTDLMRSLGLPGKNDG